MAPRWQSGDQGGHRSAIDAAGEVAERHFGCVARRHLLALGISPARIRSWLRSGRLHPRYPGVYAWGRPELSERGELAAGVLYAGPGAALGGISALWWLGLLERRPHPIWVDSPHRRLDRPGLRLRRAAPVDRQWHRGLPMVPLPLALLSATGDLTHHSLRLVLARAEFGGHLSLPDLHALLTEGRPGSRALRAAVDGHLPHLAACASPLERDFLLLCESRGLPLPEPNPRIGRFRPDMLWREQRLIVELDGRDAHSSPAQLAADAARQGHLESLGYAVLRFGWAEVHRDPDRVAAALRPRLALSSSAS